MRVLVTGATGLIGQALQPVLRSQGWTLAALVRSEGRTAAGLGGEIERVDASAGPEALAAVLGRCEAVVNLAGAPILGDRWTVARRRQLHDSRVGVTERLVEAMARANPRPRVLVSGSAVGYYGDRGVERLTEASAPGQDFLARLCQDWEAAAEQAAALGVRVVRLRTGVVLARQGGALAQMLPAFRWGLGGPVAGGHQYMAWIHITDLLGVIAAALADERYRGPINGVAPEAATSREFARTLGRTLHRTAILPLPAFALRVRYGDAASVVLASQRAEPEALGRLGFGFRYPTLAAALAEILGIQQMA